MEVNFGGFSTKFHLCLYCIRISIPKQITDSSTIEKIIDQVIKANPSQVEELRGGKEKVLGFLVGQVMKASKGKANPGVVNKLLKEKIG